MSLPDCEKCLATPCSCGNDGHMTIYPNRRENRTKIRFIPFTRYEAIKAQLVERLDELLAEEGHDGR